MTHTVIKIVERCFLFIVGGLTVLAAGNELYQMALTLHITLADILLMFLFTEVISMVGVFYNSRKIPVVYPMFIAITALARLIVLQSKDMDPVQMLYEAGAIVALALGVFIIRVSGHLAKGDEE